MHTIWTPKGHYMVINKTIPVILVPLSSIGIFYSGISWKKSDEVIGDYQEKMIFIYNNA
jgi:hypothetical protein